MHLLYTLRMVWSQRFPLTPIPVSVATSTEERPALEKNVFEFFVNLMIFVEKPLAALSLVTRLVVALLYLQTAEQGRQYSVPTSALTFRDFVPRLELLTLFRDFLGIFGKAWKCAKRHYFSLFCKSYLVLFLSFIMVLWFYAAPPQI